MAKKEKIQKLFDGISADYDKLNHLLSMNVDKGWRRRAVRRLCDGKRPLCILDVACGTGDFTFALAGRAEKMASGSVVVGLDLSEGMLNVAREKQMKHHWKNVSVELMQGDCEALPFDDDCFDRISVGFGVRNFEHLELGLSEMLRVLKPGGRLVILELSVPSNKFIGWIYGWYFTRILPFIGGKISGDRPAYEYLPASVIKFPKPSVFVPLLEKTGFRKVVHKALSFGICRMYVAEK